MQRDGNTITASAADRLILSGVVVVLVLVVGVVAP